VVMRLDNHGDWELQHDIALPAQWSQEYPLPDGVDLKAMPDCVIRSACFFFNVFDLSIFILHYHESSKRSTFTFTPLVMLPG
jgi:hypothetical protein